MNNPEETSVSPQSVAYLTDLLLGVVPSGNKSPERTDLLDRRSNSSIALRVHQYFQTLFAGGDVRQAIDAYTLAFCDLLVEYDCYDLLDGNGPDVVRIANLKAAHPELQEKIEVLVNQYLPA